MSVFFQPVVLTPPCCEEADAGTGGAPRYLVGELAGAESGPAELRLRLRMSAAQARASAPGDLSSPAPGFQAASCSLFLDSILDNNCELGKMLIQ